MVEGHFITKCCLKIRTAQAAEHLRDHFVEDNQTASREQLIGPTLRCPLLVEFALATLKMPSI
jgi:hypothetical protein